MQSHKKVEEDAAISAIKWKQIEDAHTQALLKLGARKEDLTDLSSWSDSSGSR